MAALGVIGHPPLCGVWTPLRQTLIDTGRGSKFSLGN